MKYFRKQIQGLVNDTTIDCNWNTEKQSPSPCFLRRKENLHNPEQLQLQNIKALSKAMISCSTPTHNKNKVSLKKEKEKNQLSVPPISTQQFSQPQEQLIQLPPHSPDLQPLAHARGLEKNSIQYSFKPKNLKISYGLPIYTKKNLQIEQNQSKSPINQLTQMTSIFSPEEDVPRIQINIPIQKNNQKQQSLQNTFQLDNSLSDMTFNGQRQIRQVYFNNQINTPKKNNNNRPHLYLQSPSNRLKVQAVVSSRLFVSNSNSNRSESNFNEIISPTLLNKRMQDLVETESVGDQCDIKQSVVVGKFMRSPAAAKKLSLQDTTVEGSIIDKIKIKSVISL